MKLDQIWAETDSELGMQSYFHFPSEHGNHISHGLMHADTASVSSYVYLYYCTHKAWFPCFLLSLLFKVFCLFVCLVSLIPSPVSYNFHIQEGEGFDEQDHIPWTECFKFYDSAYYPGMHFCIYSHLLQEVSMIMTQWDTDKFISSHFTAPLCK